MREGAPGSRGARDMRSALAVMVVLGATVACLCTASPLALVALGAAPLAAMLRGRVRRGRLGRRLAHLAPIVIPAAVLRAAWSTGPTSMTLLGVGTSREALRAGVVIALRILAAALWTTWLTAALSPAELERALRRMGLPRALLELVTLTRRFTEQLAVTVTSAWTAAALRGGLTSTRSALRTVGLVAGVVVVRAIDRSGRVALSLALRGHDDDRAASPPAPAPAAGP